MKEDKLNNINPDNKSSTTKAGYEKTFLVLGGGGARGAYQCGVWEALNILGINIHGVVGCSVGSINGAMVVQKSPGMAHHLWCSLTTDQIFDVSKNAGALDFSKEFIKSYGAGSKGLKQLLKKYVNESAIRSSQIDYGLVTTEFPSLKSHYLWKEDIAEGDLLSYIRASASIFPAVHSLKIHGKRFIDGGYSDVNPVAMALEKNPSRIILVSLDSIGKNRPFNVPENVELITISSHWYLGWELDFNPSKAENLLRLGFLDGLKAFHVLDGTDYSFSIRDSISDINSGDEDTPSYLLNRLSLLEKLCKIYALDPTIVYTVESLKDSFLKSLSQHSKTLNDEMIIKDRSMSYLTTVLKALKAKSDTEETDDSKHLTHKSYKKNTLKGMAILYIAKSLKESGSESIFLTARALKYLKEEIQMAGILLKLGIV